MSVDKGFELLSRGYLGQDWALEHPTVDRALTEFALRESLPTVTAAIAGMQRLLATPMTDEEHYDHWVFDLGSGYDPDRDGYTFPQWFAHALDVLTRAAASRPDA